MKRKWSALFCIVLVIAVAAAAAYYVGGVYLPGKHAAEQAEQDRLAASLQNPAPTVEPGSAGEDDPAQNGSGIGNSDPVEGGSTAEDNSSADVEPGSTGENAPAQDGGNTGNSNPAEGGNTARDNSSADVEPGSTPENDPAQDGGSTGNSTPSDGGGSGESTDSSDSGSYPGSEWAKPDEERPGYVWVPGFGWTEIGGENVELEHSEGYVSSGELSGNKVGYMGGDD